MGDGRIDGNWEASWERLVDWIYQVAPGVLGAKDLRATALGENVGELSRLYNRQEQGATAGGSFSDVSSAQDAGFLAAKLRFFSARDVAKFWGPLVELAQAPGFVPPADLAQGAADSDQGAAPFRVLDLGAGLGTATWSFVEWLRSTAPHVQAVDVTAVDSSSGALRVMERLAASAGTMGWPKVTLKTRVADLRERPVNDVAPTGGFDVVLLGSTLNEWLDLSDSGVPEFEPIAARLEQCVKTLRPGGAVVVVEPALRRVARMLHGVRDLLVARDNGVFVFGPCLTDRPCPMLGSDRHWCHGEKPWRMPQGLGELARGAGLRDQKVTYSYLTLRGEEGHLGDAVGGEKDLFRVVGSRLRHKGRSEWRVCGDGCSRLDEVAADGVLDGESETNGPARMVQLKRDRNSGSSDVQDIQRGDVIACASVGSKNRELRLGSESTLQRIHFPLDR